jgi:YfiH family protein
MSISYSHQLKFGKFETWTERPDFNLKEVKQVHGVAIVGPDKIPCEADGITVKWKDFAEALAIKTADCLPILIEGDKGVVFLHAGWRGLADGILKEDSIKNITPQIVVIGPAIHSCCFEVSEEFLENFKQSSNFSRRNGKLYFDLPQEAKDQLAKFFPNIRIETAKECTCCDKKFHSYRRDKTNLRNWNIYIKG